MKPISISEIEYASGVLFDGDPNKFYDNIEEKSGERIEVIKNLESIDVSACPGSGKTTALLAKLIILSNRMPFADGRGICVLTHTNVAIDLIKEKLGVNATKLFSYPNFFGTIQSFVDKFLAVPALIEKYRLRPSVVDKEKANVKLFQGYFKERTILSKKVFIELFSRHSEFSTKDLAELLTIERKEALELIKHLKKEGIVGSSRSPYHLNFGNSKKNILQSKLLSFSDSKKIIQVIGAIRDHAYTEANDPSNQRDQLSKLSIDFISEKILEFDDIYCGFSTESGQTFLKLKEQCYADGLITFADAYKLAEYYLNKYPEINNVFKERFNYVFIDEMQDTAKHQIDIIQALFKEGENSIIQYYGDPNQAIFESENQKDGGWNPNPEDSTTLTLKKSKRFGESIASAINPLRTIPDTENPIEGENPESKIKPHLILLESKEECSTALEVFGKIVIENKLHSIENARFVAIGRVGKEHQNDELSLKSYFEKYEKSLSKQKEYHPYLISYLTKSSAGEKSVSAVSKKIILSILHLLEIHDFKNEILQKSTGQTIHRRFSQTSLMNYLKYNNEDIYFELREKLINWSGKIDSDITPFNLEVKTEIERFISKRILPLQEKALDTSSEFLTIPDHISSAIAESSDSEKEISNVYHYSYKEGDMNKELPIQINTIHGEKGETHTATLYLETFFKKYDSERIKSQLLGIPFDPDADGGQEKNMAIKMAYVAMSRPKYLLCFAIQKSVIQDILDDPEQKEKLYKLWTIV